MGEGESLLWGPIVQGGFAGFALLGFGVLVWVVKWMLKERERLFRERENDFKHIKNKLATLPCNSHTEQLRQIERQVNRLEDRPSRDRKQ